MSKKFSEMNAQELAEARKDIVSRLQSTIKPTRALDLTDSGVRFQGGKFQAEFDARLGSLKIHSTGGKRYAGGSISVAQLNHAQNVLRRFYARANGIDLGGINL